MLKNAKFWPLTSKSYCQGDLKRVKSGELKLYKRNSTTEFRPKFYFSRFHDIELRARIQP